MSGPILYFMVGFSFGVIRRPICPNAFARNVKSAHLPMRTAFQGLVSRPGCRSQPMPTCIFWQVRKTRRSQDMGEACERLFPAQARIRRCRPFVAQTLHLRAARANVRRIAE